MAGSADEMAVATEQWARPGFLSILVRLLRHGEVRLHLAAERVATNLCGDADCDFLAWPLPRDLIEAAAAVSNQQQAYEPLECLLAEADWA